MPPCLQRYGQRVVSIDKDAKTVTLDNGHKYQYDALVSTLPLDITLTWLGKEEWAKGLQHSSSHIIGVGIRGQCPHGLKCWLYFPESNCPFYRCTVFSNYAKSNCPADDAKLPTICKGDGSDPADGSAKEGPYWSLMFEVSESQYKPVNQAEVKLGGTAGTWCVRVIRGHFVHFINGLLLTRQTHHGQQQ